MTDIFNTSTVEDITVTMKYGKGFEEPWAVFRGSSESIRENILSYYGMDRESATELTLHEIVLNAKRITHAGSSAATVLGGTVIPASQEGRSAPAAQPTGDPWAEPVVPAEPAKSPLWDQQELCTSVADLQQLWARNQAEYAADADLFTAWKAKGKALSAA